MVLAYLSAAFSWDLCLGFVIMALLAIASLASKPKRHRQSEVILPAPTPSSASLALRWRTGHRPSELGYPWALKRRGRLGSRASNPSRLHA